MPALENDHQSLAVESQEPITSAMMRNLPNDYTRTMLLDLFRTEGFAGTFDFVYVPVDFRSCSGLGYAFINFTSFDSAERFRQHFTGFKQWSSLASDKVCEVAWSSQQGLEAHIERYRNSPVMHESVPEDPKSILFEGLVAVPFPVANKKVRIPRHWHRRR
jgi:RNA recognition motif-containing protein